MVTYGGGSLVGGLDDTTYDWSDIFEVTAAALPTARAVEIRMPVGATATVRVTGDAYATPTGGLQAMRIWHNGAYQQLDTAANETTVAALRSRIAWVFPDATNIGIGPGLAWEGTIIAPHATIDLDGSAETRGTPIADRSSGAATLVTASLAPEVQFR